MNEVYYYPDAALLSSTKIQWIHCVYDYKTIYKICDIVINNLIK